MEHDAGEKKHADDGIDSEERLIDCAGICFCCQAMFCDEGNDSEARGEVVGQAEVCRDAEGDERRSCQEV